MTKTDARHLAQAVAAYVGKRGAKVKAVHVSPHLHGGHLTIRVFMVNVTAEDPEPYIFTMEELRA